MEVGKANPIAELNALATVTPLSAEQRQEQRQLIHAVGAVNRAEFYGEKNELTFSLDPRSHRPILKLVDRDTKEVIKQIPPEYVLRLAEDLRQDKAAE